MEKDQHGWDTYREEGLKELQNIAGSSIICRQDRLIKFLQTYHEIYREKKEKKITGDSFYKKEIAEHELTSDQAQKNASPVIKRLRRNIEEYYKSKEGKRSLYEIYFIAEERDYRLGIRLRQAASIRSGKNEEMILYNEHQYFITVQKLLLIRSLSLLLPFLSPFLIFSCALLIILEKSHNSWVILFIGYFGLIIGVSFIYLGVVLNRLLSRRLANVVAKFFLKMSNQHVALSSFSGKCTVKGCHGNVRLTKDFQKGIGYIAECSTYPDGHRFNIDPITLKGRRIKA